jgi:hypothetical protein
MDNSTFYTVSTTLIACYVPEDRRNLEPRVFSSCGRKFLMTENFVECICRENSNSVNLKDREYSLMNSVIIWTFVQILSESRKKR